MTTYNYTVGGSGGIKANDLAARVITAQVDLQDAADSLNSGTAFSADDVLRVLNIPANTYVKEAGLIVNTAEGDTLTLDLGDGDSTDGYINGHDAESTGAAIPAVGNSYGADNVQGVFYEDADTIDLITKTVGAQSAHTAVVTVWALVVGPVPTS